MSTESYKKSNLSEKTDEFVRSLTALSESIETNEVSQLKYFLNEIANDFPERVKDSFLKDRLIDRRRSMLQATSSLDDAKVYLSLIESFGYGKTQKIRIKVDELSALLTRNFN